MAQRIKSYKVGLFGHYGNNNLGDEAIIQATIQNLRNSIPDLEIVGFSLNPSDTAIRHGIESFPIRNNEITRNGNGNSEKNSQKSSNGRTQLFGIRQFIKNIFPEKIKDSQAAVGFFHLLGKAGSEIRFLRRIKKRLEELDVLIICGSGQLVDKIMGPWGHPYTILKWVLLAKLTGTKVLLVSMGAGPISHPLSYWMFKKILTCADYFSFRNSGSKQLIESKIPGLRGPVYPDIAHSLMTVPDNKNGQPGRKTVAINPMPVYDDHHWFGNNREKYDRYLAYLAKFIKHVHSRGFTVKLYNNHPTDLEVIDDLTAYLRKLPGAYMNKVNVISNETVQDLINTISKADIIVAVRFHSTVLPLRLGKPVLGICYHRKSKELLEEVDLKDYAVDVKEFTGDELCNKFDSLVRNIDRAKSGLNSQYKLYTKLMDEQWERLAKIIKA